MNLTPVQEKQRTDYIDQKDLHLLPPQRFRDCFGRGVQAKMAGPVKRNFGRQPLAKQVERIDFQQATEIPVPSAKQTGQLGNPKIRKAGRAEACVFPVADRYRLELMFLLEKPIFLLQLLGVRILKPALQEPRLPKK